MTTQTKDPTATDRRKIARQTARLDAAVADAVRILKPISERRIRAAVAKGVLLLKRGPALAVSCRAKLLVSH